LTTHLTRGSRVRLAAALASLLALPTALVAGASGAGAASSNVLTVKAGEYTYQLSGKPQPGWVTIDFDNAGVEDHMMAVVKLKKGVTAKQLKGAALSNADAAFAKVADGDGQVYGVPELLSPKQHTSTVAQLSDGHYGVLCFVPAPDGSPHVAHGMVKVFDVKGSKSSTKPPTDGVRDVTLADAGITVPTTGIPRNGTLKVTNGGTAPHSFAIVKINTGKSLDEVKNYYDSFFNTGKADGAAPGTIVGGVSTIAPKGLAYLGVSLAEGHYGYVSTEGDSPNDDYAKGLKGEFDVK
jgi:hypothetical protein